MNGFLAALLADGVIERDEYQALLPTGVLSAQELYALTLHFPSLAGALPGGNLAKISALSAQRASTAFRHAATARVGTPARFAKGAHAPVNATYRPGAQASARVPRAGATGSALPAAIDHHTPWRAAGWPVRDQGQRGTCVAHAVVACKEAQTFAGGQVASDYDGSEQFLYWAAKQFDPDPGDGTLHGYALRALNEHGLCEEKAWPYVPYHIGATVHQGPPPPLAALAAACGLHSGGGVDTTANCRAGGGPGVGMHDTGGAARLHRLLAGGPVSIGLPVFADPLQPADDNWNVPVLLEFGRVLDPPPQSVVIGGHAVCVVGFQPDANEPAGRGWFIVRNSWGIGLWGGRLPAPGYWGPAPGYGQVSWSYVDSYLWELCWLH